MYLIEGVWFALCGVSFYSVIYGFTTYARPRPRLKIKRIVDLAVYCLFGETVVYGVALPFALIGLADSGAAIDSAMIMLWILLSFFPWALIGILLFILRASTEESPEIDEEELKHTEFNAEKTSEYVFIALAVFSVFLFIMQTFSVFPSSESLGYITITGIVAGIALIVWLSFRFARKTDLQDAFLYDTHERPRDPGKVREILEVKGAKKATLIVFLSTLGISVVIGTIKNFYSTLSSFPIVSTVSTVTGVLLSLSFIFWLIFLVSDRVPGRLIHF